MMRAVRSQSGTGPDNLLLEKERRGSGKREVSGRPGHRRAGWQQINATVSGSLAGGEAVCGSENTDAICATDEHVSRGLRTRTSAGGPQISRAAGKSPAVAWSSAACVQRPRLCYWRTAPCLRVLPLADRWELQKGQQAKKRAQGPAARTHTLPKRQLQHHPVLQLAGGVLARRPATPAAPNTAVRQQWPTVRPRH